MKKMKTQNDIKSNSRKNYTDNHICDCQEQANSAFRKKLLFK